MFPLILKPQGIRFHITPNDFGEDLFVHRSSIKSDGLRSRAEGEMVEFAVESGSDGRTKVVNVTGSAGAAVQCGRGGGGGDGGRGGRDG
ncbi:hypothetical protein QQ045_025048 [Rhodiola kirilowii]